MACLVWVPKGLPIVWASTRPSAKATGGEAQGVRQNTKNSMNTTCRQAKSCPKATRGVCRCRRKLVVSAVAGARAALVITVARGRVAGCRGAEGGTERDMNRTGLFPGQMYSRSPPKGYLKLLFRITIGYSLFLNRCRPNHRTRSSHSKGQVNRKPLLPGSPWAGA